MSDQATKSALHEGCAINGTRIHHFTEAALDEGLPFVESLCHAKIRRPIVPLSSVGRHNIPSCAPCARKATKNA